MKTIRMLKINTYLNIAACNIKTKNFKEATASCDECLKLDPQNVRAMYRRARAVALPINAGVPDLRSAVEFLNKVIEIAGPQTNVDFVIKEKDRV